LSSIDPVKRTTSSYKSLAFLHRTHLLLSPNIMERHFFGTLQGATMTRGDLLRLKST